MAYLKTIRRRHRRFRPRTRTHPRKRTRIRTQKRRYQRGGEVFASGGFGCVFRPELSCENGSTLTNDENGPFISKLMPARYADEEYNSISTIHKSLQHIPQYADYFLLKGITLCNPAPLKASDMRGLKSCHSMTRIKITKDNINNRRNELKILRIPDGGVAIDDFIQSNMYNPAQLQDLNRRLIQLLEKGILPMNQSGIYHADIKDSNVLATIAPDGRLKTRLIDWGVSFRQSSLVPSASLGPSASLPLDASFKTIVADRFINTSLQYNVPFSSILFSTQLEAMIKKWKQSSSAIPVNAVSAIYTSSVVTRNGEGHIRIISRDMKDVARTASDETFPRQLMQRLSPAITKTIHPLEAGYVRVSAYIAPIISKYVDNNKTRSTIDLARYYTTVFLPSLDVWGFFSIYMRFASIVRETNNSPLPSSQYIHGHVAYVNFVNVVYSCMNDIILGNPTSAIHVSALVERLHTLTSILGEFPTK